MTLFFAPIATHGFVYPLLRLAATMRTQGHTPYVITGDAFARAVAQAGEVRVPRGPAQDGPSFQIRTWADPVNVALQIKHLEHAADRYGMPDVIVASELAHGPLLFAEHHTIPVAVMGVCAYMWPGRPGPASEGASSEVAQVRTYHLEERTALYNTARRQLGLPPVPRAQEGPPVLGDVYMLRSCPSLEALAGRLPDAVQFVGACLGSLPADADPALTAWLQTTDPEAPLLYVHHAQHFHRRGFWSGLMDACRTLSVRIVAATGRMDVPVDEVPANVYTAPHPPMQRVLQHADAVLASGTTTPVLGALAHGLPLLLFPTGGEHPVVAECCAGAGVADVMRVDDLTPARLAQGIRSLLDNRERRQRAQSIRASLEESGGFERAADLVGSLAA